MKNKTKKLISILLTFVMFLGMFAAMPMTVSAGDSNVTWFRQPESQTVTEGDDVTFIVKGLAVDYYSSEEATPETIYTLWRGPYGQWEICWPGSSKFEPYFEQALRKTPSVTYTATPNLNGAQFRYSVELVDSVINFMGIHRYTKWYHSEPATLYVNSKPPVISQNKITKTVYVGEDAALTINATGTGKLTYDWRRDSGNKYYLQNGDNFGGIVSGVNNKTLTVSKPVRGTHYFSCEVINTNAPARGTKSTVYVTLNVVEKPVTLAFTAPTVYFTIHPVNATSVSGETATFNAEAGGPGPITYQWQYFNYSGDLGGFWSDLTNGGIYSGVTTKTLKINGATLIDDGTKYRCAAKNSSGTVFSGEATLTVFKEFKVFEFKLFGMPEITQQPVNREIISGQSTSFHVVAVGAKSYQWQMYFGDIDKWLDIKQDDAAISGVKTETLKLNNVILPYNGTKFRCIVKGSLFEIESNAVTLTVNEAPQEPSVIGGMSGMSIFFGYAPMSTDAYVINASDAVVAAISSTSKITWNSATKKLDIAEGLAKGTYVVELKVIQKSIVLDTFIFTLNIIDPIYPPNITGTSGMTLAPGYAATSTDAYNITGMPAPTVTKASGNSKITWNSVTKKLDIAAGLAKGTYNVVLEAVNSEGEKTFDFTLKVDDPPKPVESEAAPPPPPAASEASKTPSYTIIPIPKPNPIPPASGKYKIGEKLGDVLYSDITAYINGSAIPTSIIAGKTLVVVEDLAKYGFEVTWNNPEKWLNVELNKSKPFKPIPVEASAKPVGTYKCDYVYTNIRTYLSGNLIESYAIKGVTLINFELLAKYGTLKWDGVKREIRLTIN